MMIETSYRNGRSAPTDPANRVLLTVSGEISETISAEKEQRSRPRADYIVLARCLGADLIDFAKAREISGRLGAWIARLGGGKLMLAYACWLLRHRYCVIVTDGEQVGLPLSLLLKLSRGQRPRHVMITHVISVPKKTILIDVFRLTSQIDRFIVYCSWQRDYIARRWKVDLRRIDLIPFMVDERFFDPSKVNPRACTRSRICSVGLERRDYQTLMKAVDGLDIDVVIAAASPWSKQKDRTARLRIPDNVSVRKFNQFDLRQLYADCDLFVMPLQPVEFQAGITAILEAMAMGKAVVCSKAPGQTDTIVEGENGSYVPVGDVAALRAEILRLLARPDELARLGANGRDLVLSSLSLDRYAKRLAGIVEAALSDRQA